jgi:hypothetical protein
LSSSKGCSGGAKKAAATAINFFQILYATHPSAPLSCGDLGIILRLIPSAADLYRARTQCCAEAGKLLVMHCEPLLAVASTSEQSGTSSRMQPAGPAKGSTEIDLARCRPLK